MLTAKEFGIQTSSLIVLTLHGLVWIYFLEPHCTLYLSPHGLKDNL